MWPSLARNRAICSVHELEILLNGLARCQRPKYINPFLLLLLFAQVRGSIVVVVFFSPFFFKHHYLGCMCGVHVINNAQAAVGV